MYRSKPLKTAGPYGYRMFYPYDYKWLAIYFESCPKNGMAFAISTYR